MNWGEPQQKMFSLCLASDKRTKQVALNKWNWAQLRGAVPTVIANRETRASAGVFA